MNSTSGSASVAHEDRTCVLYKLLPKRTRQELPRKPPTHRIHHTNSVEHTPFIRAPQTSATLVHLRTPRCLPTTLPHHHRCQCRRQGQQAPCFCPFWKESEHSLQVNYLRLSCVKTDDAKSSALSFHLFGWPQLILDVRLMRALQDLYACLSYSLPE